jgi:hypothetical protein
MCYLLFVIEFAFDIGFSSQAGTLSCRQPFLPGNLPSYPGQGTHSRGFVLRCSLLKCAGCWHRFGSGWYVLTVGTDVAADTIAGTAWLLILFSILRYCFDYWYWCG